MNSEQKKLLAEWATECLKCLLEITKNEKPNTTRAKQLEEEMRSAGLREKADGSGWEVAE